MFNKLIKFLNKNKKIILSLILVVIVILYVNKDKIEKINLLKKVYKEEYDSINIELNPLYKVEPDDAKLKDFVPKKTSDLIAYCDESIEECIEY